MSKARTIATALGCLKWIKKQGDEEVANEWLAMVLDFSRVHNLHRRLGFSIFLSKVFG